jgi:hypothetical protein
MSFPIDAKNMLVPVQSKEDKFQKQTDQITKRYSALCTSDNDKTWGAQRYEYNHNANVNMQRESVENAIGAPTDKQLPESWTYAMFIKSQKNQRQNS